LRFEELGVRREKCIAAVASGCDLAGCLKGSHASEEDLTALDVTPA